MCHISDKLQNIVFVLGVEGLMFQDTTKKMF